MSASPTPILGPRLLSRRKVSTSLEIAVEPGKNLPVFRRGLLNWYDANRRNLPWRGVSDPYSIWLSEIMLQQTRVTAVLNHYRIFLEQFPTVQSLATASEDAVLAAWSGLGYYRRARMLHRCAQVIVEQHGGVFPRCHKALLNLPGIGRYTSAAVASIAFAEPVALVDGNVERVLQRLAGARLTLIECWKQAQALLDESRPGDFNQAMMELGATVCLPRQPRCRICPVRGLCRTQGEISPSPRTRRQQKKQMWCALELNADDGGPGHKIRLVRRPKTVSLMPGMWELPHSSEPPRPLPALMLWRTFRHSITVTDYTVHVIKNAGCNSLFPRQWKGKGRWIAIDRIPKMPITGLTRKILKAANII